MSILCSYCDESSDEQMQRVYVMAGYLATKATWLIFSQRWRQALADAGLNTFHMTECNSGHGEFKGRSSTEREDLQRQFIEIINTSELVGSVGGILLMDYNLLKPSIKRQRTVCAGLPISGSLDDPHKGHCTVVWRLVTMSVMALSALAMYSSRKRVGSVSRVLCFMHSYTYLPARVSPKARESRLYPAYDSETRRL